MKSMLVLATLNLILAGCAGWVQTASSSARRYDPNAVIGKTWQWQATVTPLEKITVNQPERYTLRLNAEGKVDVKFDCNRGGGSYRISEGKLSFGPFMSTRMACRADTMDAEFMKHLQDVNSFFIDGDTLYLELPVDSGTLQFKQPSNTKMETSP